MKKGKKRAETVDTAPEAAPPESETTPAPAAAEQAPDDAPVGAASDDEEATAFQGSEEPTPVSPIGSDGMPIPAFDIAAAETWDGPTTRAAASEVAALAEASRDADAAADAEAAVEAGLDVTTDSEEVTVVPVETTAEGKVPGETTAEGEVPAEGEAEALAVDSAARLESILQSLLFASDRALGMSDLKRLLNQRDAKVISAALERLQERHRDTGIQLGSSGGGWQFRTHPENAPWVSKLIAGRPARLSRAMLETLAIVAYRQPITRPEIDEIRGVDCGPVLKTLLDRVLIRMIGKKEEVGRPILYGTTPEFLSTFSLKDLTELPTLREFHELGVAERAKVDAEAPGTAGADAGAGVEGAASSDASASAAAGVPRAMPKPTELPDLDPDEEDALLAELDDATSAATRASKPPEPTEPPPAGDAPAPPEVSE